MSAANLIRSLPATSRANFQPVIHTFGRYDIRVIRFDVDVGEADGDVSPGFALDEASSVDAVETLRVTRSRDSTFSPRDVFTCRSWEKSNFQIIMSQQKVSIQKRLRLPTDTVEIFPIVLSELSSDSDILQNQLQINQCANWAFIYRYIVPLLGLQSTSGLLLRPLRE